MERCLTGRDAEKWNAMFGRLEDTGVPYDKVEEFSTCLNDGFPEMLRVKTHLYQRLETGRFVFAARITAEYGGYISSNDGEVLIFGDSDDYLVWDVEYPLDQGIIDKDKFRTDYSQCILPGGQEIGLMPCFDGIDTDTALSVEASVPFATRPVVREEAILAEEIKKRLYGHVKSFFMSGIETEMKNMRNDEHAGRCIELLSDGDKQFLFGRFIGRYLNEMLVEKSGQSGNKKVNVLGENIVVGLKPVSNSGKFVSVEGKENSDSVAGSMPFSMGCDQDD